MTLLERWDEYDWCSSYMPKKEIRRALAIAQAVEEIRDLYAGRLNGVYARADELMEGK